MNTLARATPTSWRLGYKALYYSVLVGKDKDVNNPSPIVKLMKDYNKNQNDDLWSAFYEAMKRHSYSTENQSLYEDMKDTFFARIKEIRLKYRYNMCKNKSINISKSKFVKFCQCPKALWLCVNKPECSVIDEGVKARFATCYTICFF